MPIRKQDATKALELLEDYHRKLSAPADIQLRSAIERVIKIFKSKLFNALLEIQEFYEATLLDDSKSTEEKTLETMQVAERWANSQGLAGLQHQYQQQLRTYQHHLLQQQQQQQPLPANSNSNGAGHASISCPSPFEVTLERTGHGFGFSIAGGSDAPPAATAGAAAEDDSRIRVTRIVPGGAADGRLEVGDALLGVNGVDVACVMHAEAVEALKLAGGRLKLLVLRRRPTAAIMMPQPQPQPQPTSQSRSERGEIGVLLSKSARGLGFSIAGGVHNEHLPGDSGIFITKLIPDGAAQLDGRIAVGDRLVAVNGASLCRVTHEEAVATLKRTGSEVLLSVVKPTPEQLAVLLSMEEAAADAEAEAEAEADAEASEQQDEHDVGRPDEQHVGNDINANDDEAEADELEAVMKPQLIQQPQLLSEEAGALQFAPDFAECDS